MNAIDNASPTTSTQRCERATPATASTLSSDIDTSATTICTTASRIDFCVAPVAAPSDMRPPRSSRQSFQQIHSVTPALLAASKWAAQSARGKTENQKVTTQTASGGWL